ncbi:hypothetical protein B0H67DRAFT_584906 [Lasiosphaeris hirsuta]|uniref:Secreted protein n=1 Tax=Lasiosphaeris hirsuta TaxID=260670 RepID=A0AA40DPI6_9PEZI|nr:hypothetical protein B0H67DRAFT_584906 [Lasiosphaeris hirsuta]
MRLFGVASLGFLVPGTLVSRPPVCLVQTFDALLRVRVWAALILPSTSWKQLGAGPKLMPTAGEEDRSMLHARGRPS